MKNKNVTNKPINMKKLKVEASPYSENMCSPENDPTKKNRANINSHKLLTVSHK